MPSPCHASASGSLSRGSLHGKVEAAPGFEGFELLRPNDEREVCLVLTRWRQEEDFQAWASSPDFRAGHSQYRQDGPVGTASEL